jgi:antitoxin component of MazEF toxin-antitoxin module
MKQIKLKMKEWGNSNVFIIPAELVAAYELEVGEYYYVTIEKKK